MIILNYLLVITWFPLIVLFWSNHLEDRTFKNSCGFKTVDEIELQDITKNENSESKKRICFFSTEKEYDMCYCIPLEKPFLSRPDPSGFVGKLLSHPEKEENLEQDHYAEKIDTFRLLERFFYNWYVPILAKIKYCVLIFFVLLIGGSVYGATLLAPTDELSRLLPIDHPIQVALDFSAQEFSSVNALVSLVHNFNI